MAYIPPAVHARANRAPFVRPSGDASPGFTIDNMPPGGSVFLDGVLLDTAGGTWSGSTWRIPSMNGGNVLRVTNTIGESRESDQTEYGGFLPGAGFDYATMTPVADADVGTLRIFGSPHTQLLVNGVLQSGSDAGGVVTYSNLPTGTYGVVINAADGFRWTPVVNIVRGQTTQLPLVRPAAPVAAPVVTTAIGPVIGVGPTINPAIGGGGMIDGGAFRPSRPATARLVVNGPVGWRVGVGANGSNGTSIAYGALPASGSMALDLAPGTYALRVDTDRATGRLDAITVPVGGLTIDARTWVPAFPAPAPTPPAPVDRGTQGPTVAAPTKGTIVLRGAPGQAVVTIPAAGLSHTVDATGRPVALDVLPGTYGLTVTPVGDVQRVKSVAVVAGQTVEVVYGTMATPSAVEIEQVQPVELMCGPVLNRAALPWAPATACPGNELTAPDGTRWRALAATGGVTLAQLRADGTPTPAGMGIGTKVLIVGVVAAAGYAGWMWYSNRKPSKGEKQENPGKCSCGG